MAAAAERPVYRCANPFTNKLETFPIENWRRGWKLDGEILGMPVFRMINPKNPNEFVVQRLYYLKHRVTGEYKTDQQNKVTAAVSVLFDWKNLDLGPELKEYQLEPIFRGAINDGGRLEK